MLGMPVCFVVGPRARDLGIGPESSDDPRQYWFALLKRRIGHEALIARTSDTSYVRICSLLSQSR